MARRSTLPGRAMPIRRDDRGDQDGARRGDLPAKPHRAGLSMAPVPPPLRPDLPPLRDVIAAHGLRASKALGQNFAGRAIARPDRCDPRCARGRTRVRGRPRPRRPDAGAAAGRRAGDRRGARRRCLPALAELAAAFPGQLNVIEATRSTSTRKRPAAAGAYRREPALQCRDGAAGRLAGKRGLAALVAERDLDVPGRGRRADRREARQRSLWALAVLAQWRCVARIAMKVHRSAFTPPPKVMSAVVHIAPARRLPGWTSRH